jgi:hypothetical protein
MTALSTGTLRKVSLMTMTQTMSQVTSQMVLILILVPLIVLELEEVCLLSRRWNSSIVIKAAV